MPRVETGLSDKIPPPPRRLTPESLRRLSREFAAPLWGSILILAMTLLGPAIQFLVGRGWQDLLLELRCSETRGTVTGSVSEPEERRRLFIASFEFKGDDGHEYDNVSFSSDLARVPQGGAEVAIQYYPPRPGISRIAGMRCGLCSWRSFILPAVMLVIVSPMTELFLRMRRRRRQVCERGKATTGILLEPTRFEAVFCRKRLPRGPCAYNSLKYRFEDDFGRPHERSAVTRRSPFALQPGGEVTVIYDQDNPRRSIVVEALGLEFVGEE